MPNSIEAIFRSENRRFFGWGTFVFLGFLCLCTGLSCGKVPQSSKACQDDKTSQSQDVRKHKTKIKTRKTLPREFLHLDPHDVAGVYQSDNGKDLYIKECVLSYQDGTFTIESILWIEKQYGLAKGPSVFIWNRNGIQVFTFEDEKLITIPKMPTNTKEVTIGKECASTTITRNNTCITFNARYELICYLMGMYIKSQGVPEGIWTLSFTADYPKLKYKTPSDDGIVKLDRKEGKYIGRCRFFIPALDFKNDKSIVDKNLQYSFPIYYARVPYMVYKQTKLKFFGMRPRQDARWTGGRYQMKFYRSKNNAGETNNLSFELLQFTREAILTVSPNGEMMIEIKAGLFGSMLEPVSKPVSIFKK